MKIDFRQTKYLLPAVMFIPGIIVIYLVMDLFGGGTSDSAAEDVSHINATLPDANASDVDDKYTEMIRRYGKRNFDEWSEGEGLSAEEELEESIGSDALSRGGQQDYDDDQLEDETEYEDEESWDNSVDMRRLEEALARSRAALAGYDEPQETPEEMKARILAEAEAELQARQAALDPIETKPEPLPIEDLNKDKIEIVEKTSPRGADAFNTIGGAQEEVDANLIKAMIDQTTKAQDGTRLRFKLLDDVTVQDVEIKKGTYLYGTVVGFGAQRVKVAINSIFVNGKFIKVKLAVYDVDGMEGFYVPSSAFREFMREAGAQTAGTSMQINSGYGSAITGEMLALQALQNVYNAASSAAQSQIRKNKAKIKYNSVVYLINTES